MVSTLARAETVDQDLFAFVLDLALNVEQSVCPQSAQLAVIYKGRMRGGGRATFGIFLLPFKPPKP